MKKYMIALCALMTIVPSIKCVEPAMLIAMLFAAHANVNEAVQPQMTPQPNTLTKKKYKKELSHETKKRNQPRKSKNRNHPSN